MKAARDVDAWISDRFGHYVTGRHFLVWCSDPRLGGVVFWGTPDEQDVDELARIFRIEIGPQDPDFDVITDGRRLDRVSRLAFDPFARVTVERIREQGSHVMRHAVVAPEGLVGTIMAGFFPLFGLGDRFRVFREPEAAFRWVERAELKAEVEALVDAYLGESPALSALRRWLGDHFADATVDGAARGVGRSVRSLQRELGDAGSSFRGELDRARVEAARARLGESDDKLEAIAREVGCASLSSFSRLFRRVTGESPTEYRARARR